MTPTRRDTILGHFSSSFQPAEVPLSQRSLETLTSNNKKTAECENTASFEALLMKFSQYTY